MRFSITLTIAIISLALYGILEKSVVGAAHSRFITVSEEEPLPEGVVPVEYLDSNLGSFSSGGPYIDTGILPSNDMTIYCRFRIDSNGGGIWNAAFGAWPKDNVNESVGLRCTGQSISNIEVEFGGWYRPNILEYEPNEILLSKGIVFVNGMRYTFTANGNLDALSYTIYLFDANLGGKIWKRKFFGRIYQFTVWKGVNKVSDLIPCRVETELGNEQWVGAMYDKVRKELYFNVGIGAFQIGPDI